MTGNFLRKGNLAEAFRSLWKGIPKNRAEITLVETARTLHVIPWHPPACQNYKSESGCKFGDKCMFRHEQVDSRLKRSRKRIVEKVLLPYCRIL